MAKKPIAVVKNPKPSRKPKKTETHIIVLIDSSGSMSHIRHDTIGGFNTFLEEQKKLPGKATMTLYQFNSYVNMVFQQKDLQEVPELTTGTYYPNGGTAYYDALGRAMVNFTNTPPNVKTIVMIMTDGQDNESRTYNKQSCRDLIQSMERNCGWEVLFMGSNFEASTEAAALGIKQQKFAAFAQGGKGAADALRTASVATAAYRGFNTQIAGVEYNSGSFSDDGVGLGALYTATAGADAASFQVGAAGLTQTASVDAVQPVKKTK